MTAVKTGPFLLLVGLYTTVLYRAVTGAPPLGLTSVLSAAMILAILGHLFNVYKVASVVRTYPSWLLSIDILTIGTLAAMLGFLTSPISGGYGRMYPFPWVSGEELLLSLQPPSPGAVSELVFCSLHRFFSLGFLLLSCLISWHVVLWRGYKVRSSFRYYWWLYGGVWVSFAAITRWGYCVTNSDAMIATGGGGLNILGFVAVTAAAALLWIEARLDSSYEPPAGTDHDAVLENLSKRLSGDATTGVTLTVAEVRALLYKTCRIRPDDGETQDNRQDR